MVGGVMITGGIFGVIFGVLITLGLLLLDNLAPFSLEGYSRRQLSFVWFSALCGPCLGFFVFGVPAGIGSAAVIFSLLINLEASGFLPAAFRYKRLIAFNLAMVTFLLTFVLTFSLLNDPMSTISYTFTNYLRVTFSIAVAVGVGIISARTLRSYAHAYANWQTENFQRHHAERDTTHP